MKIARTIITDKERKRRERIQEYIEYGVGILIFVLLIILAEKVGAPKRWRTAIFGTVGPFWILVIMLRRRWSYWSTWISIGICLCLHSLAMWILFQYVFVGGIAPGWVLWFPIAFIEPFFLLIAAIRIERVLTGKKEVWRI